MWIHKLYAILQRECIQFGLKILKNDYSLIVFFFKSPDSINDWQFLYIKLKAWNEFKEKSNKIIKLCVAKKKTRWCFRIKNHSESYVMFPKKNLSKIYEDVKTPQQTKDENLSWNQYLPHIQIKVFFF